MDNLESDKKNTVPVIMMTRENDSGYYLESISNDDFLIGSVFVFLRNFLARLS